MFIGLLVQTTRAISKTGVISLKKMLRSLN